MLSSHLIRLHLIVFLWGFTAILGKLIQIDAASLVFFRMLFTAVFLYLYLKIYKKENLSIDKKNLIRLVSIGSVMAAHWFFFFESIKVSNVSIALSCLSLSTLFAAFIEPLVFKRKIDWVEIIIGVVIVACISLIFNAEIKYKLGIFYGVLCSLCGAIFSVLNGKMFGKVSSGKIIFYEIFGGWAIISIIFLVTGQLSLFNEISWKDYTLVVLLASLFTAYPMFESIKLMKYISPFTLILTVNLEPIYGIILAFFIFGASEHMSPIFYIASAVMILSIVVNGLIKSRRRRALANVEAKTL